MSKASPSVTAQDCELSKGRARSPSAVLADGHQREGAFGESALPEQLGPSQPKAPRKRQEREERLQEQLLAQIARAASTCQKIEQEFGPHPAPELETLLKLHRVLLFKLSAQAKVDSATLRLISQLIKPVLEEARLEEMRKRRQLAEQKYRDQRQEEQAQRACQDGQGALRPQTVERIENELKLF